ncbi:MAG: transposase family protein [Kineosporiaceae bacterium]
MAEEIGAWQPTSGRRRALSLNKAVKATVLYFKNNLTQEVIAELLDVAQSTISRCIAALEPVIAAVLQDFVPSDAEVSAMAGARVTVVDGSLCPCWSWADAPELYSGKHHDRPYPPVRGHIGRRPPPRLRPAARSIPRRQGLHRHRDHRPDRPVQHDRRQGIPRDGSCHSLPKATGGQLLEWQKALNTDINRRRHVAERVIANFKTWRTMHTDYRRPRHTYLTAFRAVRALHFYQLRSA